MDDAVTFHQIVEGISAPVIVTTADGEVTLANRHALDYLGKSLEELKPWAANQAMHPDDAPGVVAAWKESVRLGEPYQFEHRIRRADGAFRWFQVRGLPVRGPGDRILHWFVLYTDIHERRRAEALLAGEKRLLEMVASGHPLDLVLDALCRVVEHNGDGCFCSVVLVDSGGTRLVPAAGPSLPASYGESLRGWPAQVDVGPCAMAVSLREQVITADTALETRWPARNWCSLAIAHGLRACWSTPIFSRARRVLGTFAIYYREPRTPTALDQNLIEQFTHLASIAIERANDDAVLKRSEESLAEAQRLNRTGSFVWRPATDELTCSREAYRIYALPESQPLTLDLVSARVHPDDLTMYLAHIARARREPMEVEFDVRLRLPDGSIRHLHHVSHGSRSEAGDIEYTGAVQDITDWRNAEDALARLQSELAHVSRITTASALTASITHEVSQPLSGIITNANTCVRMLAEETPNLDGARETVRRMIRDAGRASDVIARLRALFARKQFVLAPVDLNNAAREVIALSLSELQRNRITLRTELASDLPLVSGDQVQLQQVILNLILNASQAMRAVEGHPKELIVRTESDSQRVRLAVRDVGIGFQAEDADRLFNPFYTTKIDGMGIGLSVSRRIVERHGGELWATRNDDSGATFTFSIPRLAGLADDPGSIPPPPQSSNEGRAT
jgi:PAS domain S-box-containing protein